MADLTFKLLRSMSDEEITRLDLEMARRDNYVAMSYISTFRQFGDKQVEVFKGRKVPVGTKGRCFWCGARNYGKYSDPWGLNTKFTVGIKTASGDTFFTSLDNIRLLPQNEYFVKYSDRSKSDMFGFCESDADAAIGLAKVLKSRIQNNDFNKDKILEVWYSKNKLNVALREIRNQDTTHMCAMYMV